MPSIGFLTVINDEEHGMFGGYLVLNSVARPLEFHCTAPVRPNRAQEILYGPTLKSFLYGDQIGQTLLAKAKSRASLVWTNVGEVLSVRPFSDVPVGLLLDDADRPLGEAPSTPGEDPAGAVRLRIDAAHPTPGPWRAFALGERRVAVCREHLDDQIQIQERWSPFAEEFDLLEPFERIRDAIGEAKRGGKR